MRWELPKKYVVMKYVEGNKNTEFSVSEKVSNVEYMSCQQSSKVKQVVQATEDERY